MKTQKFLKNNNLKKKLFLKKEKLITKKKERVNTKFLIKKTLIKNLYTTPLYEELISSGAFIGDYYKWTHFSQTNYLIGYRNNYSFYNIESTIYLLTRATRFLKKASAKKNLDFIFVGNPKGSEEESSLIFKKISRKFFPNDIWHPGFFSKKKPLSNYVLVIYNIKQNHIAFNEAVYAHIPVVAFVTPECDIRGVDYPVILNLNNNKIWYANYCKALFKKVKFKKFKKRKLKKFKNDTKSKKTKI